MQSKELPRIAVAAIMMLGQANGQRENDNTSSHSGDNGTLYGPLKVIHVSHVPSTFKTYPNNAPQMRNGLDNGGLDQTCSGCNQTGCLCPDLVSFFEPFARLCENCRSQPGGELRCYCSPALQASPCNGTEGYMTRCSDSALGNDSAPSLSSYCEPQRWDQDPMLTRLTVPTVVYDYATMTIKPGANVSQMARMAAQKNQEVSQDSMTLMTTAVPPTAEPENASNSRIVSVGVAAIAAAAGAAFLMGP